MVFKNPVTIPAEYRDIFSEFMTGTPNDIRNIVHNTEELERFINMHPELIDQIQSPDIRIPSDCDPYNYIMEHYHDSIFQIYKPHSNAMLYHFHVEPLETHVDGNTLCGFRMFINDKLITGLYCNIDDLCAAMNLALQRGELLSSNSTDQSQQSQQPPNVTTVISEGRRPVSEGRRPVSEEQRNIQMNMNNNSIAQYQLYDNNGAPISGHQRLLTQGQVSRQPARTSFWN